MSSDSFQLLGMAERGFLPKALGKRSKHDTPTVSPLPLVTSYQVPSHALQASLTTTLLQSGSVGEHR